jgi:hypothetical protein
MSTHPLLPQRMWNMRPWRTSPLMRVSYRVESVLHAGAVILILLAIPVAVTLGAQTYTSRIQQCDRVAASIHATQAVLDSDANPRDMVYGVMTVKAHWRYAGRDHSGETIVTARAKAGEHIPIWVNNAGDQTSRPPTHAQALPDAVAFAVGVYGLFAAFVLAVWHLVGWRLELRRCAGWSREWAALENVPKWNHP